jgi:hypothetical protein
MDERRQPTQPLTHITGNIPMEFVTAIKGNASVIGSNHIDEYLMPSSRGISPAIKNLVQIRHGWPTSVVNSGTALTRSGFSALRANTNGLTNVVWFYVNGKLALDDRSAPFEIPVGSLVNGVNEVLMISHANGLQNRVSYHLTVNP